MLCFCSLTQNISLLLFMCVCVCVCLCVDLSHEEAVGPQPAKKCKPLSPIKKLTSEPPALSCDTNELNSKREPNLSQETIVSPPTHAVLHTSASPSSLASPLLEPSSSQHLTVRWGPVSPAFLIKGLNVCVLLSCRHT